uniref:Uncharacterized protein n=1 Tax=Lepeophtheirus salmonis TaxID=72036 RepID=A0A0K2VDL0_LEPSM
MCMTRRIFCSFAILWRNIHRRSYTSIMINHLTTISPLIPWSKGCNFKNHKPRLWIVVNSILI